MTIIKNITILSNIYDLQISENQVFVSAQFLLTQCGHLLRNFGVTRWSDFRWLSTISARASIKSGWSLGAFALLMLSIFN